MNMRNKKGLILLSMPRSGSSWLASMSNAAGTMGKADEWLDFGHLTPPKGAKGRPALNAKILHAARTANGNFAVKIFPRQLLQVIDEYEYDFIRRAMREQEAMIVMLERKDHIAQAVSLVRAVQTGQWRAAQPARKAANYNFGAIAQAYFHITRGYDFWRSYLALQGFAHRCFTYESLLENPAPYLESIAAHFGQPLPPASSPYQIQRNPETKIWRARFVEDIKAHGIPASAYQQKQPEPGLKNALKLWRGRATDITRFGYST